MQFNSSARFDRDSANNNINISSARLSLSEDPATLIHTCFAKVYTMPITSNPKIWAPVTQNAVPVSFYFDKQRSVYRILSYDGDRLVINSTVIPTMAFMKPSCSFGLWNDTKLRVIFGLGFANQAARDHAGDWFAKVVKAAEEMELSRTAIPMTLPPEPEPDTVTNTSYAETTLDVEVPANNYEPSPHTLNNLSQAVANTRISCPTPNIHTDECSPISCGPARVSIPKTPVAPATTEPLSPKRNKESLLAPVKATTNVPKSEEININSLETMDEAKTLLAKKIAEGDKLMEEVKEAKEQLQMQIKRADKADNRHREERKRAEGLELEVTKLKSTVAEQTAVINEIKKRKTEIEQNIQNWKEKLRLSLCSVEEVAKEMENVKVVCRQISDKAENLLKVEEKNLNSTKTFKDE